jgi:hypothetical protein
MKARVASLGGRGLVFAALLPLAALALVPIVGRLPQVLTLLAMAGGAVWLIFRPHWGALAMSASWLLGFDPLRMGPLGAVELLSPILVVPLALDVIRERRIRFLEVPQIWTISGIALVLVAATVWSELMHPPPPHAAYEKSEDEFRFFVKNLAILIFFVSFVRTPRQIRAAVGVLLFVIVFLAVDALVGFEGEAEGQKIERAQSMGIAKGDPNRLGSLCVWGTALFWALFSHLRARRWWPLTLIPMLGLPVVALMTASRSALLQLLILAGLMVFQQRRWSAAQCVRGLALVLAAAFLAVAVVPAGHLARLTSYGTEDVAAHSTQQRREGLWAGVMMAAQHPILGVGPGNFRWRLGRNMGPHNSYLWALTSGGPALLALYLLLLYQSHRGFRAAERSGPPQLHWVARAMRFNLLTFLFFSAVADVWLQQPFYWLIGLSAVLARLSASLPVASAQLVASAPRAETGLRIVDMRSATPRSR